MILYVVLTAIAAAVFAYALLRGDEAIRTGSSAGVAIFILTAIGQALSGWHSIWPVIVGDLLIGFVLIVLAAIYPRRWLYAQIVLCAGLLLVHAFLLQEGAAPTPLYRALNNGLVIAMLGVLVAVTFVTDRRRRRAFGRS